ncbi:MAG: leucine-rich repeat protein [Candidatus Izemoplasma sp.]
MKFKNLSKILVVFIFIVSLGACNSDDNGITVTLYNGDDVVQEFKDIEEGTVINLVELFEDDMLFIGYEDDGTYFYNEYIVTSDISLYASFEVVSEVFEYTVSILSDHIHITGYLGNATYLKIPQKINNKVVTFIEPFAFEESNLIEVIIPVDAKILNNAFLNSTELVKVSFHGNYILTEELTVTNLKYDEIMDEYSDTCVIISENIEEGKWIFSEGCPIKEVINVNPVVIIGDDEYFSYNVVVDINYYQLSVYYSYFPDAFKGATALTSIVIPKADTMFQPAAFTGCYNISEITVAEGNTTYTIVDGVLYKTGITSLIYYPPSKAGTSFIMPDSVTQIYNPAFIDNMYLETLTINANYTGDFEIIGLDNLKEIIVDSDNQLFQTVDGVLFSANTLVKYPAAKSGSSYTIPNGITVVGTYAFSNNKYIETIELGSSLTDIYDEVFYLTEKLKVLDIPSNVLHIGGYILHSSSIEVIIINRSFVVDGIGTSLIASLGGDENVQIYFPDDSLSDYLTMFYWGFYATQISPLSEYVPE